MLTRWFFRWGQGDSDFAAIGKNPVSAMIEGAFLVEVPKSMIVIGFNSSFWRYGRQTIYRSSVREAAHSIGWSMPNRPISDPTLMIWSNEERLLHSIVNVRALKSDAARLEAETMWAWICNVVSMPVQRQRAKSLYKDFDRWELETRGKRKLPTLPSR